MLKNLQGLLRVLGKYRSFYFLSTLLLFLSIIARSLEPKVLQMTVDHVLATVTNSGTGEGTGQDFISRAILYFLPELNVENLSRALLGLGLVYLAISVFRGTFLFASVTIKDFSTEKAIKQLRDKVFGHIQSLPMSFFSSISRGELIQRCTGDIDTIKRFVHHQVVAVLRLSSTFLFSFGMMCMIDWKYALISIVLGPLIFYMGFTFFNRERKVWKAHEIEADKLNTMVQENLNGIRVVTAFSNQGYEIDRFGGQNKRKLKMGLKQADLHTFYWSLTDMLVNLQLAISVIAGGYFALHGRISIGELLGFYTYIGMVTHPMRQLGKVLSQMGMAIVAMGRVSEILDILPEEDTGEHVPANLHGHIEFRGVTFYYEKGGKPALENVDFSIQAGERVAIIGPSGSGKSTLVKLLLRLYEPSKGEILLDGKNLKEYPKAYLRENIGVAMQRAFLFSKTIGQNIAYAKEEMDELEVEEAARVSRAHEMKVKFPEGFQTMVGEKGVTLSGGQKQRVALARTVITWPKIIVLDDTTSAVDTLTEVAILKALDTALDKKTSLVIAHRISSIRQADKVIVLEKGKVVQCASVDELENVPGYYQLIHQVQAGENQETTAHS